MDLVKERCSCPDWELRRQPCKHVHATHYWVAWGRDVSGDGTETDTVTGKVKRKSYLRDWNAYTAAQTNEGTYVERLLRALCDGIPQPPRKPGPRWRALDGAIEESAVYLIQTALLACPSRCTSNLLA